MRHDHLSRNEIRKDAVQGAVEAAAATVGQVTSIVTGAVRDIAGALGGFATEVFEIRESARRASLDQAADHAREDAGAGPEND
jgi:hypothetical protein